MKDKIAHLLIVGIIAAVVAYFVPPDWGWWNWYFAVSAVSVIECIYYAIKWFHLDEYIESTTQANRLSNELPRKIPKKLLKKRKQYLIKMFLWGSLVLFFIILFTLNSIF